ncbi:hypothetical protein CLU79DRAFT_777440 [Phycomyces nitens]|nr:hypothetical protein CLU79DRAFT_777440 [Phycomyces nitens]
MGSHTRIQSLLIIVSLLSVMAHSPLLDPPHLPPSDCATSTFYSSLARPLVWSCLGLTVLMYGSRWLIRVRSAMDASYEKTPWESSKDIMPCRFEMPRLQRMSTRLEPTPPITPSTSTSSAVDSLLDTENKEVIPEKRKKKKKKAAHNNNHHQTNKSDTRNPSSSVVASSTKTPPTKVPPLQTPAVVPPPLVTTNTTTFNPPPEHKPPKKPQAVAHQRKAPRNKTKYPKHTLTCEPLLVPIHTHSPPLTTPPMTTSPSPTSPSPTRPPLQPAIVPPTHQPIQQQNWYSPFSTGLEIDIVARPAVRDYKLFEDTLVGPDPLSYRTSPISRPLLPPPGWRPWTNDINDTDSSPHFSLFDRKLSFHTQH